MQNKANLLDGQMSIKALFTTDYGNFCFLGRRKNKANPLSENRRPNTEDRERK
jgi:hypothetical protein